MVVGIRSQRGRLLRHTACVFRPISSASSRRYDRKVLPGRLMRESVSQHQSASASPFFVGLPACFGTFGTLANGYGAFGGRKNPETARLQSSCTKWTQKAAHRAEIQPSATEAMDVMLKPMDEELIVLRATLTAVLGGQKWIQRSACHERAPGDCGYVFLRSAWIDGRCDRAGLEGRRAPLQRLDCGVGA